MWMVGIKRKASVVLCMKAESTAGAMQSTKLLRELLLMTENDGQKIFCSVSCLLRSLCMEDGGTETLFVQGWLWA